MLCILIQCTRSIDCEKCVLLYYSTWFRTFYIIMFFLLFYQSYVLLSHIYYCITIMRKVFFKKQANPLIHKFWMIGIIIKRFHVQLNVSVKTFSSSHGSSTSLASSARWSRPSMVLSYLGGPGRVLVPPLAIPDIIQHTFLT